MSDIRASMVQDTSAVVELRQYTLHPGKREALISLFEEKFVEPQRAAGIRVLGRFRDADDPDRFVWLRGFRDIPSRAPALQSFYGGPVWKANRDAANATMIDSDDVLLLRPVDARSGWPVLETGTTLIVATLYLLTAAVDDAFNHFFETRAMPLLAATGGPAIARFQTEYARNDFPSLPVREGEHAFVWFSAFASEADHQRHLAALRRSRPWTEVVEPELAGRLKSPARVLRLQPTAQSLFPRATGSVHDFDFLAGDWKIVNRRLKARGVGSKDWDEFPARSHAALHLDGVANVDEIQFPTQAWSGMTVRAFNPETRQWSIYWINSRTGTLFPPVVGGFAGNRGEFYGDDEDNGRPVKVRFIWTRRGEDSARWEQAFSPDGWSWETNWVMELTRLQDYQDKLFELRPPDKE
ncbi:MAG TPA: NIPSNAP family protein [Myxococcales bacterium]|nr:NIPSNAP family protein [Myxococcales bacterium]